MYYNICIIRKRKVFDEEVGETMYRNINIADLSECANNEWFLFGAVNVSMIGGFTMFVGYLFGVCIGTLFMKMSKWF